MRILLVAPETIDMHTKRLVQMLFCAGHSVTLVARENPLSVNDARYIYLQYPQFYLPAWFRPFRLRRLIMDCFYVLFLRYAWLRSRPDVVHTIYVGQGAYYCALARLSPLVLTALGSDINDPFEKGNPAWRTRVVKTLKTASCITADTQDVLNRCETLVGGHLEARLFYFGIDLRLFYPRTTEETLAFRQKLDIPLDAKVILSPRRLTPKMNHDVVLKAFARYLESNDKNAVLILRRFGSFSIVLQTDLQRLAEKFGVSHQVIWLDEIPYEEIPILYSLAKVVINVPEQDGLPVSLFEASACKVPVITSNLPSYQEYLSEGDYFRVAVGDVDGIVFVMQRILGGAETNIKDRLQKNYDLVVKSADQEKCFALIEDIYQDVQDH